MKEIIFSNGGTTFVDDNMFDILSLNSWHRMKGYKTYYAVRYIHLRKNNYKTKSILMHRLIAEVLFGVILKKEDRIDHIDGNGLNNCISNLRIVNTSANVRNSNHKGGKNKYRGAHLQYGKYYAAHITINGKSKHLGSFKTPEQAAHAYDTAYRKIAMDDLRTNFKAPLGWCFIIT